MQICPECYLIGGPLGVVKGGISLAKSLAAGALSLTKLLANAAPVGSALKGDGGHYVASLVREEALSAGQYATKVGGDGIPRIEVLLKTTEGLFEYLYQEAKTGWEITHQFFRPK